MDNIQTKPENISFDAISIIKNIANLVMQNSSHSFAKKLSSSGISDVLVDKSVDIGKTIVELIRGEITSDKCIEQLLDNNSDDIKDAIYSIVPEVNSCIGENQLQQAVNELTGGAICYVLASYAYNELSTAREKYNLARENRIRVEQECKEAIDLICQYRQEMNENVEKYFVEHTTVFNEGFNALDNAILESDVNGFIAGNVQIQKVLGREVQFENQDEFDNLMLSTDSLKM